MTTFELAGGLILVAKRGRGGRRWRVRGRSALDRWVLDPLGDDVVSARSGKTGKWQGGPRSIERSSEELYENWRVAE